jgi:hypothetical protein
VDIASAASLSYAVRPKVVGAAHIMVGILSVPLLIFALINGNPLTRPATR